MKIYEIPKTLNPEAKEWRPPLPLHTPPLLPHAINQPPPPPPPPPLKLFYHLPIFNHYHYHYLPLHLHTISSPAAHFTAANAATPAKNTDCVEEEKKVDAGAKSPTRPCHDVCKGQKKFVPPRLRRASRSRNDAEKQPPPVKQEWRCKNDTSSSPPLKREWRLKSGRSAASPPPHSPPTTVMIRNIPNQIRRSFLLKFLDHYCKIYSLEYDLLYLPIDFRKLGNLGYAFVNFTTAAAAEKVKKILCNYRWQSFTTDDGEAIDSSKVVHITWARIQGKEALVRRFQNSRFSCSDSEFLPVVLDPPRNGLDPNPPPPVNLGKMLCKRHSYGM